MSGCNAFYRTSFLNCSPEHGMNQDTVRTMAGFKQHHPHFFSCLPCISSRLLLLTTVLVILLLSGCGVPVEALQDTNVGGESPAAVVRDFFTDLNSALRYPDITEQETRDLWALRLSNYFPPTERMDQRAQIGSMLTRFANDLENLEANQHIVVAVLYEDIVTEQQKDGRALVRLVAGELQVRTIRIEPNGTQTLLRDQRYPLSQVLGDYSEAMPVLEANDRWFLTEEQS
jgi:hypothetical protein